MRKYRWLFQSISTSVLALLLLFASQAQALPAFARQTGLACSTCHDGNFPALTSFGRNFKLNAYTMTNIKKITLQPNADSGHRLSLVGIPQISAMFQISATHLKTPNPGVQNNQTYFPDQLSIFFAGELTPHAGIFSQITHSQGDQGFTMDNTDIRAAAKGNLFGSHKVVYGVDANNSPTVGDLWNSTPTWGIPYASSADAYGNPVAPYIDGGPDMGVAGVGTYAMLDNTYYGNVAFYRSSHGNNTSNSSDVVKGVAPYWRLAWQHDFGDSYLMVGTYGIYAKVYPSPKKSPDGITGPTSTLFDKAVDFQYEQPLGGANSLVVHGSYTNETRSDLDGNGSHKNGYDNHWDTAKLDTVFNVAAQWRPTLAWFNTTTGKDKQNSDGYIASVDYFPYENLSLSLQYTGFEKYAGDSNKASGYNSIAIMAWTVF